MASVGLARWGMPRWEQADDDPAIFMQFEVPEEGMESAFRFTPPVALSRLASEWEPQRALILGMSFTEMSGEPKIAQYQLELMAIAHRYVDIYVFGDDDQTRAYAYFLSLISGHPEADAIMAKTHFVDSRNLIRWTRDYGPVFALTEEDQPVVLDFVYRTPVKDPGQLPTPAAAEATRRNRILQADAMPGDVAVFLQQRFDTAIDVVRPPLWMDGGDFIHNGQGDVFVSTKTMVRNGGNRPPLVHLMQAYFGARSLHVLQSLPGSTVNHLDMIFRFLDSNTVLLADYQDGPAVHLNAYRRELVRQVKKSLAENEAYMRKHFPNLRVLKMPIPPIAFRSLEEILTAARSEFLGVIAVSRGLITAEELNRLNGAAVTQLEERTLAAIRAEIGVADMSTVEGFNAVMQAYGQYPLERYIEIYSETTTQYRSYLNSLFLHSPDGRQAFIVPRFSPRNAAEAAQMRMWEAEVEKLYREAWPRADIHWINCDNMIDDMGFIHCTTQVVPNWPM